MKNCYAILIQYLALLSVLFLTYCGGGVSDQAIYSIGRTLTGLTAGSSITLSNNDKDKFILSANGTFSFPTRMANGAIYKLSISTPPVKQTCTFTNGAGTVAGTNVTGLNVICGIPLSDMLSAGSLATASVGHTATLLANGQVLVAGGVGAGDIFLARAELYDPVANTWRAAGSLITARAYHTAILLGNGQVLVTGGMNFTTGYLASAELYDPVTDIWTAASSLATARYGHTAILLGNGQVQVAGGDGAAGILSSVELYDPVADTWSATGNLVVARGWHTATLLANDKVLVVGGYGAAGTLGSAELYDPVDGTWRAIGSLTTARYGHTSTLQANGKVLVTGGNGAGLLAETELYDPATDNWIATGRLATARGWHTATLLANGQMLVTGGMGNTDISIYYLSSAELYDPVDETWNATGNLVTARYGHTATLLANGQVLVAGGNGEAGVLASAELYR